MPRKGCKSIVTAVTCVIFFEGQQLRTTSIVTPMRLGEDFQITGLNDQHAYLRMPADAALAVGDIVMLGVSHPCTTFDKWDVLYGVDDGFNIVEATRPIFSDRTPSA
jgi:D-serine dehydratase